MSNSKDRLPVDQDPIAREIWRGREMKKFWVVMLLMISACSTSEGEVSILDKSNCTLPCWNNIIAGQTTEDAFLQVLEELPDVDQESIYTGNQSWTISDTQIYFDFRKPWYLSRKFRTKAFVDIKDNIVSKMTLCGGLRTTIGEIVDIIGEPESIISGGAMTGGKDVILIWSETGVYLWYNTNEIPENVRSEVSAGVEISCLNLFEPDLYYEMMEGGSFSMGYYNAEETLKAMYSWDGYGNLNEKYPFRNPK